MRVAANMAKTQQGSLDAKTMLYWTTLSAKQLEQFKREEMKIPAQYEWKGMQQPYGRAYLDGRVKRSATDTRIDTNLTWGDDYLLLTVEAAQGEFEGSLFEDMEFYNKLPVNLSRAVTEKIGHNVPQQTLDGLTLHDDVRKYFEHGVSSQEYRNAA